ncbi:MAG: hypothetical protein O7D34_02230 [Ignavibacteria bacterium]|nr:hypothetical protein [Ignavibacteria bacterium]
MLEFPGLSDRKFTRKLSAAAGTFSEAQVIPGFVDDLVATVKPGPGGTALLQFTGDDEDIVDKDPGSVTWITWTVGAVSIAKAQTALGAVTAVRLQAIVAPATMSIVANRRATRR